METTSQVSKSHQPCEDCGSSDALAEYDDGHTYCFSCNHHRKGEEETYNVSNIEDYKKPEQDTLWQDRKIGGAIAEFYEVKVQDDIVYFPYFSDGVLKASKLRMPGKEHKTEGEFRLVAHLGERAVTEGVVEKVELCTQLIPVGAEQLLTLTIPKPAMDKPYTLEIAGVEGQSIEVVVP